MESTSASGKPGITFGIPFCHLSISLLPARCMAVILVLFGFCASAQQSAGKKQHYQIMHEKSESVAVYEKAMENTNLDSLRFVSERRKLPIDGTTAVLELYSGQELLDLYKKQISIFNIKDPYKVREVKLKLSPDQKSFRVLPLKEQKKHRVLPVQER